MALLLMAAVGFVLSTPRMSSGQRWPSFASVLLDVCGVSTSQGRMLQGRRLDSGGVPTLGHLAVFDWSGPKGCLVLKGAKRIATPKSHQWVAIAL